MTRSIFGWSLPPGVTQRMIDAQCEDTPCAVCGRWPDDCLCPECPTCGCYGDPTCYREHGLVCSAIQIASLAEAEARWQAENDRESAMLEELYGHADPDPTEDATAERPEHSPPDWGDDPLGDWHGKNE